MMMRRLSLMVRGGAAGRIFREGGLQSASIARVSDQGVSTARSFSRFLHQSLVSANVVSFEDAKIAVLEGTRERVAKAQWFGAVRCTTASQRSHQQTRRTLSSSSLPEPISQDSTSEDLSNGPLSVYHERVAKGTYRPDVRQVCSSGEARRLSAAGFTITRGVHERSQRL
eukprot:1189956-Prorocentrum_minimum.AAC.4